MNEPKAGQSSPTDKAGVGRVRWGPFEDIPLIVALAGIVGVGIGIALCVFWLSQQPWWLDPLIANAVRATVAAQPTATPAPTNTSYVPPTSTVTPTPPATPTSTMTATPTPVPQAHIIEPVYLKGPVPVKSTVVLDYRDIPADRYLWVVVRVPKVAPAWRVFPQLLDGRLPTPTVGSGTLRLPVQFGNPETDAGEPFNVVVLLLDAAVNRVFIEYADGCIGSQNCAGIELPAVGVELLDFNTVVRR